VDIKSIGNAIRLILVGAAAVAGVISCYDHYIEPKNDGPMERAGEKIGNALDSNRK
jgi:hypothetical protein